MLTASEDYDLFCRQRLTNPYPLFARLCAEDPLHWCDPMQTWLITRYDDTFEGLRDTQRLSSSREAMYTAPLSPENRLRARPLIEHLGHWLLNVDGQHPLYPPRRLRPPLYEITEHRHHGRRS